MGEPCRQLLLSRHVEMNSKGLRCLGLAYNDDLGELLDYNGKHHLSRKKLVDPTCYSSIETDFIVVGMVGLRYPPHEEVKFAVEECHGAGIEVMVITADYKLTAEATCIKFGMFHEACIVLTNNFFTSNSTRRTLC
ncbi:putative P-type Ca(2+) transporter [Helianthus debilis subsp. tardiflorus]